MYFGRPWRFTIVTLRAIILASAAAQGELIGLASPPQHPFILVNTASCDLQTHPFFPPANTEANQILKPLLLLPNIMVFGKSTTKVAPSKYPKLLFHGLRSAQMLASLVVGAIMFYFIYHLNHDHRNTPWTFIFVC
jgi:hypothetical protein